MGHVHFRSSQSNPAERTTTRDGQVAHCHMNFMDRAGWDKQMDGFRILPLGAAWIRIASQRELPGGLCGPKLFFPQQLQGMGSGPDGLWGGLGQLSGRVRGVLGIPPGLSGISFADFGLVQGSANPGQA